MEITGILVKKLSEREGVSKSTGNPWKTAEFLFEIPGQYPRHIAFSVRDGQTGRIATFDAMVGKTVIVVFSIDAREHEGRWYNEVGAYGIREYVATAPTAQPTQASVLQSPTPAPEMNGGFGQSDIGSQPTLPMGQDNPPF